MKYLHLISNFSSLFYSSSSPAAFRRHVKYTLYFTILEKIKNESLGEKNKNAISRAGFWWDLLDIIKVYKFVNQPVQLCFHLPLREEENEKAYYTERIKNH